MKRQSRKAAPYFKLPVPFDPRTGRYAPIGPPVDTTRVAVFQVTSIQDDYLVCRGYDPEARQFFASMAVAKPYLLQKKPWNGRTVVHPVGGSFTYTYSSAIARTAQNTSTSAKTKEVVSPEWFVGDLLVCGKCRTAIQDASTVTLLGDTPGGRTGADAGTIELSRPINIAEDGSGNAIHWVDLNTGGRNWHVVPWATSIKFTLSEESTGSVHPVTVTDYGTGENPGTGVKVDMANFKAANGAAGTAVLFDQDSGSLIYLLAHMDHETQTVITQIRSNASERKLEYKTRTGYGEHGAAESGWTAFNTGSECG